MDIFKKIFFSSALLIGLLSFSTQAQNASSKDSALVLMDSIRAQPPLLLDVEIDSVAADSLVEEAFLHIPISETPTPVEIQIPNNYKHSPHKASIYAAVFPGAGQIYNKKYWKVPLLYAGIGGFVYAIHFNTTYYDKYRSAYRDFLIRDPGNTSYVEFIPPGLSIEDVHGPSSEWFQRALQNRRRYYKRYRDISYIGLAALYLASIIDASVDAHFYDFDISDDLSLRVEPAMLTPVSEKGSAFGLQMRFQF